MFATLVWKHLLRHFASDDLSSVAFVKDDFTDTLVCFTFDEMSSCQRFATKRHHWESSNSLYRNFQLSWKLWTQLSRHQPDLRLWLGLSSLWRLLQGLQWSLWRWSGSSFRSPSRRSWMLGPSRWKPGTVCTTYITIKYISNWLVWFSCLVILEYPVAPVTMKIQI